MHTDKHNELMKSSAFVVKTNLLDKCSKDTALRKQNPMEYLLFADKISSALSAIV